MCESRNLHLYFQWVDIHIPVHVLVSVCHCIVSAPFKTNQYPFNFDVRLLPNPLSRRIFQIGKA